jgi:hypothetical protein
VRAVEAWLLADRERIASFLAIATARLPHDVEAQANPKRALVSLAAASRRRAIREDMVPRPGSGRTVGPAYVSRLIEFVSNSSSGWRPDIAAERANSLLRTIASLHTLTEIRYDKRYPTDTYRKSSCC